MSGPVVESENHSFGSVSCRFLSFAAPMTVFELRPYLRLILRMYISAPKRGHGYG
jgi:hypothetical protein